MTRAEASRLASRIRDFWKRRGYAVETAVIKEPWVEGFSGSSFGVRTNLKNGLPPGFKADPKELKS